MTTPAISIDDVSKKFVLRSDQASSIKEAFLRRNRTKSRDFWALRNVSFDIPKGSFYGIIGHNGSGKSTLLRLIAGIHEPTTGSIRAAGRISALLELGSGFHPDLTGRENVFLNGAMLGLGRQQMADAIDQIADFSGLGDFIDAPVKVYSSGMHVRLGFAISVHVEPEILLVDEVLAVGDEEFQRKCFDHIYMLRRRGTTIVLVSHDAGTMETLCDEVAWLDHGQLQQTGEPSRTLEAYLHRVNEKEHREREELAKAEEFEPAKVIPVDDEARRGSGEIRVRDVTLHDETEQRVHYASAGGPLIIRVHYEAATRIYHPVFGLGVYHETGVHLAGPNSKLSGAEQPILEAGTGFVDIILDPLPLLPGNYSLTLSVYSADVLHCYDLWDHAIAFPVRPGPSPERYGLVDLNTSWSEARNA